MSENSWVESAALELFYSPGACSIVTMTALEAIDIDYTLRLVDIRRGDQKTPAFMAVNPKGKVPALRIDGQLLTENAAILYYLSLKSPLLLPPDTAAMWHGLEDLIWCSSSLHPITRQVRMPSRYTAGDTSGVKQNGLLQYESILQLLSDRFAGGSWWYGMQWSIVDTYIYWNYTTAANGGLDLSMFPAVREHADRVQGQSAFMRATARQDKATN